MSEGLRGNCQELGHIHIYSTEKFHDDDECHEGKQIISSYSPASEVTFDLQVPNYNLVYDFVWTVENFFSSPYLEVQRKPPKIA